MITVVGLGPGKFELLTLEAYKILKENPVYLRTSVHPVVDTFEKEGITYSSFDHLYENAQDFDTLYTQIAKELLSKEDAVYAVPGNPLFFEESVKRLYEYVPPEKIRIVPGISFIDVIADLLGAEFDEDFDVLDAYTLEEIKIETNRSHLITQVHNRFLLSDVKLKLMQSYPDDYRIAVLTGAGTEESTLNWVKLFELDRRESDHLTTLYVPKSEKIVDFDTFTETIRRLRAPDGCPWDREQTHTSLKRYILEEAAEVVDAIDKGDIENLKEELGDVLLQVVLHAQIAVEADEFNIHDVIRGINEKMIRRHPHVFGSTNVLTSEKVIDQWESIKRVEKETNTISEEMRSIPLSLSALLKSDKIQDKARSVGFDWDDPREAIKKVAEERTEVIAALEKEDRENLIEEIGDLLFACVNVARLCKIDSEEALRRSNEKFIARFEEMERLAQVESKDLTQYSLDELEKLWEKAKSKENESR